MNTEESICGRCGADFDLCRCDEQPSIEDEESQSAAERMQIGCLFPGKCCMPGEHLMCECHTVEMMESYIEEQERA